MFTWSSDPNKDMWNHLSFLSNKSNCKGLLLGTIETQRQVVYGEGDLLEKKSKQMSMCIKQAREYFEAAEKVSINTSPVLYFYGMLALAKALIIADYKELFLEDINYHGLHTRPKSERLRAYKSNPENWEIEKEYALASGGVFKYLTQLLSGFMYEDHTVFYLKDILAVCPEIYPMYERFYREPSQVLGLYDFEELSDSPLKIRIDVAAVKEDYIFERVPEFKTDFELCPEIIHHQARRFIAKEMSDYPDYLGLFSPYVGGRYIVGGLKHFSKDNAYKKFVDPAIQDYIAMFILSITVRYKQDLWGEVVSGDKSGILSLLELYISAVKRRFPNIILDHLFNERFEYGSPARFV